jgi:hypothetical protein
MELESESEKEQLACSLLDFSSTEFDEEYLLPDACVSNID